MKVKPAKIKLDSIHQEDYKNNAVSPENSSKTSYITRRRTRVLGVNPLEKLQIKNIIYSFLICLSWIISFQLIAYGIKDFCSPFDHLCIPNHKVNSLAIS